MEAPARTAYRREDGWVVRWCCDCDVEITDPRWQKYSPEELPRVLCGACGDRAARRHREDWWRRD